MVVKHALQRSADAKHCVLHRVFGSLAIQQGFGVVVLDIIKQLKMEHMLSCVGQEHSGVIAVKPGLKLLWPYQLRGTEHVCAMLPQVVPHLTCLPGSIVAPQAQGGCFRQPMLYVWPLHTS